MAILKQKVHRRGANVFDCLTATAESVGKHGKYESIRSVKRWLAYIIKDGNYVAYNIDVESMLASKGSAYSKAVASILAGASLDEVFKADPGVWARYYTQFDMIFRKIESMKDVNFEWKLDQLEYVNIPANIVGIHHWIMCYIRKPFPRRTEQLWIQGPPASGKSRLACILTKLLKTYIFPDDNKYEDYTDDYEVIIYDEPQAQPLRFMNKFLSGEYIKLPGRYKQTLKKKNIPFIFLSNNEPHQIYKEASQENNPSHINYQAFCSRLKTVVINMQDLHTYCDMINQLYESLE